MISVGFAGWKAIPDSDSVVEREFGVRLRPMQREIIRQVSSSIGFHRAFVIQAPTGTGKSLVAEGLAKLYGADTLVVTPLIYLQKQYLRDFSRWFRGRFAALFGRRNYPCPYLSRKYGRKMSGQMYTADDCVIVRELGRCPFAPRKSPELSYNPNARDSFFAFFRDGVAYYESGDRCPYYVAKMLAEQPNVQIVVTNYDYFFLDYIFVGDMFYRHLLVFDEGHNLFDKLYARFTRKVTVHDLDLLGVPQSILSKLFSVGGTHPVVRIVPFLSHVVGASDVLESYLEAGRIQTYRHALDVYRYLMFVLAFRHAFRVRVYRSRMVFLVDPISLVAGILRSYFTEEPVQAWYRGQNFYFEPPQRDRRVLIMSGTVGTDDLWDVVFSKAGLSKSDYRVIRVGSSFDVSRRPVYYVFWGNEPLNLSYGRYADEDVLIFLSSQILYAYRLLDSLGLRRALLVHAYKVDLARMLYDYVLDSAPAYGVDPGEVNVAVGDLVTAGDRIHDAVQHFVDYGGILITSTGAAEGVDFAGDICRLQFIVKAPFPGSDYPEHLRDFYVAKTIVQMAGRVVRSASDFGATVVFDDAARRHYLMNTAYYPKYFRDAVILDYDLKTVFDDFVSRVRRFVLREVAV